ncbi:MULTISPECIES: RagB/SusD family nutrient uptake outer membrane protein [Spirosoma]|uniref:RagB/SusD family nutrient uptake outer membrane protein n=1 Tax=Spirosoma sordidisoli TaxID=2502893 RepID=A0A4Q2UFM9_9BACT|nr:MULTISPECIES: RagB/SusD family nutrient uptake outer membrane protein [Spirosoma]RYC67904.1 RagB/SusD family nutrient uptake outer membrane protein [Spirosoma sordidisoli]
MNVLTSITKTGVLAALLLTAASCLQDLDRQPVYDVTSASVYKDPANYKQVLAKLYAVLAVSGQQGPAGKPDIAGIDEGFSNYLRQYWKAQELTTDEAVIGWNDGSLPDYHNMNWSSSNEFITAMYNRIFYMVTATNEFIRETTDAKLAERGITGQAATDARTFRAEARFLRALAYTHAIDLFGSVPFVTETDAVGSFQPRQISRAELFTYVETELKAIEEEMAAPRAAEYGRADRAAAWTLLAKLYLNAQVYTGTARYTDAVTYANKVIQSNAYALDADYSKLFLADNGSSREIILPVTFDGTRTKTYGGMTFLVHAAVGGKMSPTSFGINSGWAGLRTTKGLVDSFADPSGRTDTRALFFTDGQNLEINEVLNKFEDGYAITKFKNVTSAGQPGSDVEGNFPDTDFPLFRLADVYLMYAEAVLRGGTGGDAATALTYVNLLRQRAYKGTTGNITATALTLDFILSERARELYWEGHRRTDLIRYGRFTEATYLWPFKGGVKAGRAVESFRTVFPLPAADLIANPNLKQNTGY